MDRFNKYVHELFDWNEEMKNFLASENVDENSELWEKLDHFTDLIESVSLAIIRSRFGSLQTKAEIFMRKWKTYFKRKQEYW